MYKTISISNSTYQNLQAIASRLDKPKSQVIDDLIKEYSNNMKEIEKKQLHEYNAFVADLAKRVKLPKETPIRSEALDKDLASLQDQDF